MNRFRQILSKAPTAEEPARSPGQAAPSAGVYVEDYRPPQKHPYDPRRDLEDPGRLWATVLATAHAAYGVSDIYTFLQGLRILECRLFLKPDGRLHLDTEPAVQAGWSKNVLRDEWLMPRKAQIVDVFSRAEAVLQGLPPGARVPAWMRRTG